MKDIIQELNDYNVPIIKVDDTLAKVKYENRFSQKLEDANAFLAKAGVPKSFTNYLDEQVRREQDDRDRIAAEEIKTLKKGKENGLANTVIGLNENDVPNDVIAKSLTISIEKVEETIKEHEKKA